MERKDSAPDIPPRVIEIWVTSGEDIQVSGEDQFAEWEIEAIYTTLLGRSFEEVDEDIETEGGNT
jgi:hypothetical protein